MAQARNRAVGAGPVVGLDLGGTKMLGVVLDEAGVVRVRLRRPTAGRGMDAVRDGVLHLLADLLAAGREAGYAPVGIGIGSPGYVQIETGTILDATNLDVLDLPLGPIVSECFDLPALVVHDVKAAALGEARFGAAAGARQVAFLNAGTGIAVGLILNGHIFHGAAGRAGEIGHVVILPDGPPCPCGLRGCLEMLASGPAIAQAAEVALQTAPTSRMAHLLAASAPLTAEIVAEAGRQGDATALAVIERAAEYLGLAIAGMINVLDLECVIVGGGLSQMGELLLAPLRAAATNAMLPIYRDEVAILPPALAGDAGAIGAAWALYDYNVISSV